MRDRSVYIKLSQDEIIERNKIIKKLHYDIDKLKLTNEELNIFITKMKEKYQKKSMKCRFKKKLKELLF